MQHICADTLRSIAVLVAAGIATLFPAYLTPIDADSAGSIVVSLIIFASLLPLIQGLWTTAHEIRDLGRQQ
jgi:Co/Zn/Cd efflux system component